MNAWTNPLTDIAVLVESVRGTTNRRNVVSHCQPAVADNAEVACTAELGHFGREGTLRPDIILLV